MKNKKDQTPFQVRPPLMEFYPEIEPYSSGYLAVDKPHEMYWEQCGNPDGVPIVVLHGGPGAGCSEVLRQFFDPEHYRIILFDQRGSGRSTPHCCLDDNNTAALVRDIEQLRKHLSIKKWHIFGGSWGSTLALSYAAEHAKRCLSMTLRGIFLMEQGDLDWFLYTNQHVFPEAWEQFASLIDEDKRDDLLNEYHKRLTHEDKKIRLEAAINWTLYESACSLLMPNYELIVTEEQQDRALALATLECHYFKNHMIKPEDSLLNKVDNFRHIPTTIVQGRYDMVCPIISAHKLHNVWPEADYITVTKAGHSALDPIIRSRLIEATEHIKNIR